MALWYYGENGQQLGPLEEDAFRAAINQGRLNPETLVWREGMAEWRPLAQVAELALPQQVPVYHSQLTVRTSGNAIASMVCGIAGLTTCIPLAGIPAVICGHLALSNINHSAVSLGGRGMAIAGLVMGYLQVLLCLATITALVVFANS